VENPNMGLSKQTPNDSAEGTASGYDGGRHCSGEGDDGGRHRSGGEDHGGRHRSNSGACARLKGSRDGGRRRRGAACEAGGQARRRQATQRRRRMREGRAHRLGTRVHSL